MLVLTAGSGNELLTCAEKGGARFVTEIFIVRRRAAVVTCTQEWKHEKVGCWYCKLAPVDLL